MLHQGREQGTRLFPSPTPGCEPREEPGASSAAPQGPRGRGLRGDYIPIRFTELSLSHLLPSGDTKTNKWWMRSRNPNNLAGLKNEVFKHWQHFCSHDQHRAASVSAWGGCCPQIYQYDRDPHWYLCVRTWCFRHTFHGRMTRIPPCVQPRPGSVPHHEEQLLVLPIPERVSRYCTTLGFTTSRFSPRLGHLVQSRGLKSTSASGMPQEGNRVAHATAAPACC